MFKIYDEPESPKEGGGGVFKIHGEPASPNEAARLRHMIKFFIAK